jgi:hypothetical protein
MVQFIISSIGTDFMEAEGLGPLEYFGSKRLSPPIIDQ